MPFTITSENLLDIFLKINYFYFHKAIVRQTIIICDIVKKIYHFFRRFSWLRNIVFYHYPFFFHSDDGQVPLTSRYFFFYSFIFLKVVFRFLQMSSDILSEFRFHSFRVSFYITKLSATWKFKMYRLLF